MTRISTWKLFPCLVFAALAGSLAEAPQAGVLEEVLEDARLFEEGELEDLALMKHKIIASVVIPVRNPTEQRRVRFAHWRLLLEGDQKRIYDAEGFPTYRHRENFAGSITEHWTYPEKHITYVFSGNELLRKQIY